ncbi:MAG TPA: Ig-like domain-containing domain [Bacteroidia bacterium]|nr:Ig-like domain-containing domain [Bacteroidia bacterium]
MRKVLAALLPVFLAACAQVLTPDGGSKDVSPPVPVRYSPDSAATNFGGKRIVIRFNEYIRLNDLDNQLVVSPPLATKPRVDVRKKEIVIELRDTLLDNTTYTISFGNAIMDITEGNILENFRYVFSTGPLIDSLTFSGKVMNATTLAAEKGIWVMLYQETEDSLPLKNRPYYFTKTAADGSFLLTNLRGGTYKVFALDDKSQDYLYNTPEERIAFADDLLSLNASVDSFTLYLFQEKPSRQKRIRVTQPVPEHLIVAYTLPLKDPKVEFAPPLPANVKLLIHKSVAGDSLELWLSALPVDSIRVLITDETLARDTGTIFLLKPDPRKAKTGRGGAADQRVLRLASNVQASKFLEPQAPLVVYFNNPVRDLDEKRIWLLSGKDTVPFSVSVSPDRKKIQFAYPFLADSSYALWLAPGAITDWLGQANDTFRVRFSLRPEDEYGSLKVVPSGIKPGNYILQVLNEKNAVVQEKQIRDSSPVVFEHLVPGQYSIKLVVDSNNNGKWDTGNYFLHRQPERVIIYPATTRIRAGWDMDVEWIFQ